MPFPVVQRVVYDKSPLHEVVSKFAFPTLLKIEALIPADFQELVRTEFPRYSLRPAQSAKSDAKKTTTLVGEPLFVAGTQSHVFESADCAWKLVLTREKMSLATTRYGRWETFQQKLAGPLAALKECYKPAQFSHVCVRYQNLIRREQIGLSNVPWNELVQPWVAGPLASPEAGSDTRSLFNKFLIDLPRKTGQVDAACGIAQEEPSKRPLFFIEAHVFSNLPTSPDDALTRLGGLHDHARNFFRWCIKDRLHNALGARDAVGD